MRRFWLSGQIAERVGSRELQRSLLAVLIFDKIGSILYKLLHFETADSIVVSGLRRL
jgi:hypothetical protein